MAALALGVALGGVLAAALGRVKARRGPEGPRLLREARAVAHRGGAGERIENTLEAFENAVAEGCDWLELDVRRTRDDVIIVCHDRDLFRQCGRHVDVTQLDYKDLPPYQCPLEVTFSPGRFSRGRDRRLPRLDEIFRRFPRQPISVEIKDDDDDLINEVASLVRIFDRAPITLWASFREPILRKCRKAHPQMPFCFSLERGLLTLLCWYLGLLPLLPLGEAALLFPLPSIINRTYFPVPRGLAGEIVRKMAKSLVLRPSLLNHLKSRGIQVWLWVANEERDFADAFSLGANGVITDYPGRLRRFLEGGGGGPGPPPHPRGGAPPPGKKRKKKMKEIGGEMAKK